MLTPAPVGEFWAFVNERHRIYVRRSSGEPKPWTDDPILLRYKFTNIFRQLDTGTIWLTKNFLEPHRGDDHAMLIFNAAWFRMFNWVGTGARLGWQTSWRGRAVAAKLAKAKARGEQIFTGAHIVFGGGRGVSKIDAVVASATALWKMRNRIAQVAARSMSLEAVFNELCELPGVGPFIAYEIVTDLRHTRVLDQATDINTWANVGPGAWRGLRRMYPDLRRRDALAKMRELLAESETHRASWVPPLELRDVEHSLCEFLKYARCQQGGKTRSRYDGI